MAIKFDRFNGQSYSQNIIDPLLGFQTEQTWTVIGSGTAALSNSEYFNGSQSLYIENTDPTNDLTASNAVQSTVTPKDGSYMFSFYLYKDLADVELTGDILFYKGDTLYNTQSFTLGSTSTSDDINETWVRYISDVPFDYNKGEVFTIQIKLNGIPGYPNPSTYFWISGLKLEPFDRGNDFCSWYTEPISIDNTLENRITVNQDNVATTLGGVIDPNKEYFLDGIIDLGLISIEVPADGININGYSIVTSKLFSSSIGHTTFVSPIGGSGNIVMSNMTIEVTQGQVYDVTGATGGETINLTDFNYDNCNSLGEIDNFRQGFEVGTGRFGGTPELTLSGTWLGGYSITSSAVRFIADGAYTLFKEGTSFEMNSRFVTNINADLNSTVSLLDFKESNFPNSDTLQLNGTIITRNGVSDPMDTTITPNIDEKSISCDWRNNTGIPNTYQGGEINLGIEATTTINNPGDFEELAGVFTSSNLDHFDIASNGELRYLSQTTKRFRASGQVILEGGANDEVSLRLAIYRDATATTEYSRVWTRQVSFLVFSRNIADFTINDSFDLNENDRVLIEVANESNTGNIIGVADSYLILSER